MRVIPGFGNIPPVRRWETGIPMGGRRNALPMPQRADDFFRSPFRVEAAGYGLAPRANAGEPIAALRGLSGFSADTTPCEEDRILFLRDQIQQRLGRVSPGIKVFAEGVLKQTEGTFQTCEWRRNLLQQAHDTVINDIRSAAGELPKTPTGQLVLPTGEVLPPGATKPSFVENFYKDGKLTPVGIGAIVAGGLLVAAISTGTAGALLGRRR